MLNKLRIHKNNFLLNKRKNKSGKRQPQTREDSIAENSIIVS